MQPSDFSKLTVGLVADNLTTTCLELECRVVALHPEHFVDQIAREKIDFVLVESAWQACDGAWKGKIASYKNANRWRELYRQLRGDPLVQLASHCRKLSIPAVFWNKEDSVHFARFIHSARLFDRIFTVDSNAVEVYRSFRPEARIDTLTFPVQTKIHRPDGRWSNNRLNFLGSYSSMIHPGRRNWQDRCFSAAADIGIDVYDRNSDKPSSNYRYPRFSNLRVFPACDHRQTADIYRSYVASLNVNTVTNSPTMFSRRLIEILACGGLAITNRALSVEALFAEFVCVADSEGEFRSLFEELLSGRSPEQEEMALAASDHVSKHHSYGSFLSKIVGSIEYGSLGVRA